jgi:hypothetical protein
MRIIITEGEILIMILNQCNTIVSFCFQVTIIGVHSPKYEHEKIKANVRHAVNEQSLPFTVVNDNVLQVWKHVGCQLWPTVLVFGPDSLPIYIFEGENHVQHLETFLLPVIAYYKSIVSSAPIKNSPEDFYENNTGR